MIDFKRNYSVHFVGIGGISMQGLAKFCLSLGWKVSGSDLKKNSYVKNLKSAGATIFIGHKKANIFAPDFVVKSSSVKDDNEEIAYAKRLGVKVIDRAIFVAELTKQFKTVIAVAGAHGKSTTSAMIFKILKDANKKVSCHIGAEVEDERLNLDDDILVLEACEFNKSFLKFKVDTAVVLNVDKEHLDCYGSFYQLKLAFKTFLNRATKKYVFDDKKSQYLCSSAVNVVKRPVLFCDACNKTSVCFQYENQKFELNSIFGEQYVYDACCAIKVCKDLGVEYDVMFKSLKQFQPLKRRNQFIKKVEDCNVFADYAHHPTEIKFLIKQFGQESLYVFQPHTYSRTEYLFNELTNVFKDNNVLIYKEYSAREKKSEGKSAYDLFCKLKTVSSKVDYADSEEDLKKLVDFSKFKNVVFVGAGDIFEICKRFVFNV